MTLCISPEYKKGFTEDTTNISIDMLDLNGTHVFIASHKWDTIEVTLTEDTVPEKLHYLHVVSDNIIAKFDRNSFTNNIMRCLCELYPDKAGLIRQVFLTKGNIVQVVPNVNLL